MTVSLCCGADFTQKMFMEKNGKRRELPHSEFEKLRGNEQERGNYTWIPGVIFRFMCDCCKADVSLLNGTQEKAE